MFAYVKGIIVLTYKPKPRRKEFNLIEINNSENMLYPATTKALTGQVRLTRKANDHTVTKQTTNRKQV